MWICLNNAFLSVVDKDCGPDELLVRARRKGDIERVFPLATVTVTPEHDYRFRARIKREEVALTIADQVRAIDYPNFKGSVKNNRLHNAYMSVWGIMNRLQPARRMRGAREMF